MEEVYVFGFYHSHLSALHLLRPTLKLDQVKLGMAYVRSAHHPCRFRMASEFLRCTCHHQSLIPHDDRMSSSYLLNLSIFYSSGVVGHYLLHILHLNTKTLKTFQRDVLSRALCHMRCISLSKLDTVAASNSIGCAATDQFTFTCMIHFPDYEHGCKWVLLDWSFMTAGMSKSTNNYARP